MMGGHRGIADAKQVGVLRFASDECGRASHVLVLGIFWRVPNDFYRFLEPSIRLLDLFSIFFVFVFFLFFFVF